MKLIPLGVQTFFLRLCAGLRLLVPLALFFAACASADTLAHWRFETGPGGGNVIHSASPGAFSADVPDITGNGNDLSVWDTGGDSGYAYRSDVSAPTIPISGVNNLYSVQNTGGSPSMFTGTNALLHTITPSTWTLEFLCQPENGDFRTVIGRDSVATYSGDPGASALYFGMVPGDALTIKFCDVSGYFHQIFSAPGLVQGFDSATDPTGSNGVWQAAAAVCDGTTLSLYYRNLEGGDPGYTLVAQTNLTASGSPNTALTAGAGTSANWTHGTWTVGRGLYGSVHVDRAYGFIDEVRISDAALSPTAFLFAPPQVYNVNDSGPGSLRQAVADATDGDTITFAADLSGLTIFLATGEILVTNSLTIDALPLPGGISIDGNAASRIFEFSAGTTNGLRGLTLTNAQAFGSGGSIANHGTLTVDQCTLTGNTVTFGIGAGIYNDGTLSLHNSTIDNNFANFGDGGGVHATGALTITNCIFSNNSTSGDGGAILLSSGPLTITGSTFSGNNAGHYGGGAYLPNSNSVAFIQSTFLNNTADSHGGAIYNNGTLTLTNSLVSSNAAAISGGGVGNFNTMTLVNCTISSNVAPVVGGGIDNWANSLTVVASTITANTAGRGGGLRSLAGAVTLAGTTFSGNTASDESGGVDVTGGPILVQDCILANNVALNSGGGITSYGNTTLSNSWIIGNSAGVHGGGIYIPSGTLLVTDSVVSTNQAASHGGGVYNDAILTLTNSTLIANAALYGGGIGSYETTKVARCTLSYNSAVNNGGGIDSFISTLTILDSSLTSNTCGVAGGGVLGLDATITITGTTIAGNSADNSGGVHSESGTLWIQSSTVTGNIATNQSGGGVYSVNAALTVTHSTITGNSATNGSAGGLFNFNATTAITNTVLAGNTAASDSNIAATYSGNNNLTSGDPLLAPLGNYGGPTQTMPPLPGSAAIDAGLDTGVLPPTDQRGVARVLSGGFGPPTVDIGAVEWNGWLVGQDVSATDPAYLLPGSVYDGSTVFPGGIDPGASGMLEIMSTASKSNLVTQGEANVISDPESYGLYTESAFQALALDRPFITENPSNNLFTVTVGLLHAPDLGTPFTNLTNIVTTTLHPDSGEVDLTFPPPSPDAHFFELYGSEPTP